ncbi:MAG TPA: GMC family oxidoreductase [Bacteroidetes bacterium]|nr:GMC family oxidoreductase [Bacteroidota bacterium]
MNYDFIIIGSGFGGSMAARQLVNAGRRVLMLERGDWVVRGPHNWHRSGSLELTPHYDKSTPLRVVKGGHKKVMGLYASIGGPSVFYGGVSFRFRERDFESNPQPGQEWEMEWPVKYEELEPYYTQAEQLLHISGESGVDPTEPYRSAPFPQGPQPLAVISQKIKKGAKALGLHPFQLPLAINYEDGSRNTCTHCTTCDTYACAIGAKNDLATMVLPGLLEKGMELRAGMVVCRLRVEGNKISEVVAVDRATGVRHTFRSRVVILSAGALGSAQLLLASGLDRLSSGGHVVGRYLMRHVNAIVFGIFPGKADKEDRFHKQLAILDYYYGHTDAKVKGKLGSLQQMPTPPAGLVENEVPGLLGKVLGRGTRLLTGLLAIAEDQPRYSNRLTIDPSHTDRYGLPQPVISHVYTKRDLAALKELIRPARKILSKAGAIGHYVHPIRTFSHSVGTVRMGNNPATSALDRNCRLRGLENLYVLDGSFMPSSAALNPSLTIAANALRVGEWLV